jgi:hypothetical protein
MGLILFFLAVSIAIQIGKYIVLNTTWGADAF